MQGIDIRLALEQFGTGFKFGGSVTDGTQQAWDAVHWEDSRPKPTWEELCEAIKPKLAPMQVAKRAEINAGFDAAMTASLTMPSRSNPASAVELALAIEDFKADDPTGWTDLRAIHEARRTALLAVVDAATTPEAVQAITVTYAV